MGDVAARVGVSRQLVSLVLRDQPGASVETRERVRRAADELGYRPDIAARMLRRRTSQYLGVAFHMQHSSEVDIVESLYPAAELRGYSVVLSAMTPTREERTAVEELLGYRSEAIILIGSHMGAGALRLLADRVPIVAVGRATLNAGCDVIRSDGDRGMSQAVEHLVTLGHRHVAYLHGSDMPGAGTRQRGYKRAMKRFGLAEQVLVVRGDYTEEAGADAAHRLLGEQGSLPTAVIACNDHMAVGLIHSLLRAGLAVPDDVSVVGYDDSRIARLSYVDLTSVRQDPAAMSEEAVRAAVDRISRVSERPRLVVVPTILVVRGSTGTPRPTERVAMRP